MRELNEFQKRVGVGLRQTQYHRVAGSSNEVVVRREDNGKIAGTQTEHWKGNVDANIFPPTLIVDKHSQEMTPS